MSPAEETLIQARAPDGGTVDRVKNGTPLSRIATAWLLVLMLALAASIVTIAIVNTKSFGPEKTVANYLAALKDGNGAKAMGLLHAKVPGANAAALDGESLALSQKALENLNIAEAVAAPDNKESVTVSYTVGETAFSSEFILEQGPKHWLFFDSWEMMPTTLPTIDASVVNANQASINGADANMPHGKNSFAVFYPGNYEFEYRSDLFAAPPATRTATGPRQPIPAVALATGPTSGLLAQVDGTIRKYLDACVEQAVLLPTGCPMSAETGSRVLSPVTWSIAEYPAITISPYEGAWIMAPLTVKAQVAYQEQDLFTGRVSEFKKTDSFDFSAKLSIEGSSVGVTPVVDY